MASPASAPTPRIDADVVAGLVAEQFPQWAGLAVEPVLPGGNDNRTFRLGPELVVRVPSRAEYAPHFEVERVWLPRLAPRLPLPVPVPIAVGEPGRGVPWRWSVQAWLPGEDASTARVDDPVRLAVDLAEFLKALRSVDATGAPGPGPDNFFRGAPPSAYDDELRDDLETMAGAIDARAATTLWEAAEDAAYTGPPVWLHGDVAAGNLLVRDGRLAAVLDFGQAAVGDPACDLTIGWTLFEGAARDAFFGALRVDAGARARARAWALWKALVRLRHVWSARSAEAVDALRVVGDVVAEHGRA